MDDCLFCSIVSKEIESKKVYEDDKSFAFEDIDPQAPVHILIIPKKHISSLNEVKDEDIELIGHLFAVASKIAKEQGFDKDGYRVVVNTGENAGQAVFHIHVHLLSGRPLNWPPG